MKLKRGFRVKIKKVIHASPKLPVKFTEGMTGRAIGIKKLIAVRLDKFPRLRYFYLPEELKIIKEKTKK